MTDLVSRLHQAVHTDAQSVSVDEAPDNYLRRAIELQILVDRYVDWRARQSTTDGATASNKLEDFISDKRGVAKEATQNLNKIEAYYRALVPVDLVRDEILRNKNSAYRDIMVSFLGAILAPIMVYLLIFALRLSADNVGWTQFFDITTVLGGRGEQ